MHKAAGDFKDEDTQMMGANVQRLVTADGTYATQSAFSANTPAKKNEDRWGVLSFTPMSLSPELKEV